jgi:hypothetical protein
VSLPRRAGGGFSFRGGRTGLVGQAGGASAVGGMCVACAWHVPGTVARQALCYGLGLIQFSLQSAMDVGAIVPQPVAPLAHVLMGALDECALYVARAEDPPAAREECATIFDRILRSITPGA